MSRDRTERTATREPGKSPPWAPGAPLGVLAIQGSFALHERSLSRLGAPWREVRKGEDLEGLSGLVIPGGESTTLSLLMEKYGVFEPLRRLGLRGFPMLGTCAGAILLGCGEGIPRRLAVAPIELERNAYGSQVDSFTATLSLKPFREPFHGVFIRAPKISRFLPQGPEPRGAEPEGSTSEEGIEVLGEHEGVPVLVACGRLLLATFHPELTDDLRIHRLFLERCVRPAGVPVSSTARSLT